MTAESSKRERFEQLLDESAYQSAWRYSYRLCLERQRAEDLLQDALTEAFLQLDQLRDAEAFRGWLLSIVRTKFFRLRQQELRQHSIRQGLSAPQPDEQQGDGLALLRLLPQPQQEILSLYYIEGLSLAEAGQVLGIPARAAKQRLFRARTALRRRLDSRQVAGDYSALL